jgi:tetratricopeptide (TPR) repeat protein
MLAYLGEPEENHSEAAVFRAFSAWLRHGKDRNWLLIIDSADSEDILLHVPAGEQTEGNNARWIDYLGPCNQGSILFTTRSRSVALKVVGVNDIVMVKPMERKHALALLEKKLGDEYTLEKGSQLAKELDFIPLAMVQAASYIIRMRPRCSVERYIAKLQESNHSMRRLLTRKRKRQEEDLRRDREAENSIFLTWRISFEHMLTVRKSAIDLLSLMSCFDREAIPEALLGGNDRESGDHVNRMGGYNQKRRPDASGADGGRNKKGNSMSDGDGDYDSSSTTGSETFEEDILILRHYSFISVTTNASIFGMHRLVQLATQGWLESRNLLEHWQLQFITNLNSAFPVGNFENWTKCRELFPHALIAFNMTLNDRDAVLRQASLLDNSGLYALERGDYGVAKQMVTLSMDLRKQNLGEDDPATVTSMHNLALLYQNQGEYQKALKLGEQVVEKRKRSYGSEHSDTLVSMNNVATSHRYLASPDLAATLHEYVLRIRKKTLGDRDLETAISMNNLSTTYQQLERYAEAAELGERALETRQSMLGPEHPRIATSMSNLAITYQHLGRYEKAADLGHQALKMKKKMLGPEHPQVATSMSNLAMTYRSLKLYDQASELDEQALDLRKRALQPHPPEILICMSNLASSYRSQKRYEEAAKLGEQVLQERKQAPHLDYPSIANSMGNLASTYRLLGRYNQAIELGREALELRKSVLKPDHSHIATSMRNLALSCQGQGLNKEAAELQDQALKFRHRVLGPRHPDTLVSRGDLANALRALNHDEEAIERALHLASPLAEYYS